MTGPLRILSLEDDPQAFELIRATLASDQIACEWIYTEDRRGYVAALEEGNFDLILADYSLPSIDGRTALELALENRPEVPFIFVSGSLGEEVAIETLKSGATDYVLKDRLSRLAPAVRRALREAAEHRERLEAQRALRESEERYRLLIENSDDLVVETDSSGLIHYASPSHVRRLGNSPSLVGRSLLDYVHPEDHPLAREKLGLSSATGMLRLQHADGDWRWFDCAIHSFTTSVGARRVVFVSRDVTERRKADEKQVLLEAQLRQSQKLEAVGLLAGGVAHDFNNLLQVIIGYTLLAMDAATPANERSSQLTEVKNAADRASQLTRQLLAFSRRQPLRREATNLNRLVSDLLRMIRRLIGEHIEVHFKGPRRGASCIPRFSRL